MVDHVLLHRELAHLAAAVSTDFDLHDGLHQLSVTAATALGVAGAGVTLHRSPTETEFLAASDAVTLDVQRQQDTLQEGACVDAVRTAEVVAADDLGRERRWPLFTPVLLAAGFRAVVGVPIRFRGRNIGAINLYDRAPHAWSGDEFAAGRLLADLAAGYLINSHLLDTTQTLATQLQHALDSRVSIEQAKGVMAGRYGMTPDAAFEVMRGYARTARVKLHDVASDIVTGELNLLGHVADSTQAKAATGA